MREELSVCEAPIMKIIWESNPDISVPELVKQLNAAVWKRVCQNDSSDIFDTYGRKGIYYNAAPGTYFLCARNKE